MTTDDLPVRRTKKYADLTLAGVSGSGVFSGYASVFGEVDLGKDAIAPGAFARSLDKRGAAGVRMLYQHDPSEPLGRWRTIREDRRGLYVEGVLSPDVERAREVLSLMKSGALDGLSIGFQTRRSKTDRASGVRRILDGLRRRRGRGHAGHRRRQCLHRLRRLPGRLSRRRPHRRPRAARSR